MTSEFGYILEDFISDERAGNWRYALGDRYYTNRIDRVMTWRIIFAVVGADHIGPEAED